MRSRCSASFDRLDQVAPAGSERSCGVPSSFSYLVCLPKAAKISSSATSSAYARWASCSVSRCVFLLPRYDSNEMVSPAFVKERKCDGGEADLCCFPSRSPSGSVSSPPHTTRVRVPVQVCVRACCVATYTPSALPLESSNILNTTRNTTTHTYSYLLYTSPSPRDRTRSRMPSSA